MDWHEAQLVENKLTTGGRAQSSQTPEQFHHWPFASCRSPGHVHCPAQWVIGCRAHSQRVPFLNTVQQDDWRICWTGTRTRRGFIHKPADVSAAWKGAARTAAFGAQPQLFNASLHLKCNQTWSGSTLHACDHSRARARAPETSKAKAIARFVCDGLVPHAKMLGRYAARTLPFALLHN